MANTVYDELLRSCFGNETHSRIDLASDTILAVLLNGHTIDATDVDYGDIIADEYVGSGYTAGGMTLASPTLNLASNTNTWDAADTTWATATISATHLAFRKQGTSTGDSPLICIFDFGGTESSTDNNFTAQYNASGILTAAQG